MPKRCHVCKIECERPRQCSKCHGTIYCSVGCQKNDWKQHKRSTCVKPALIHKLDKMMNKYSSREGTLLNTILKFEEAAWAERRRNPQPVSKCDGCFRRFGGFPPTREDIENAQMAGIEVGPDAGEVFKRCSSCDYAICEDCTAIENQGIPFFDRPRGTCRCPTSNFGISYCLTHPIFLDGDGRKPYHGDRHPPIEGSVYPENAFETNERACRTCGVVARCLKKEHLKDAVPGIQ